MANIKDALVELAETISGESNLSAEDISSAIELIEGKYTPSTQAATATKIGGVKAASKGEGDTVEVKIGTDKKLYAPTYPVVPIAANQAASVATDAAGAVADLNALLAKLKTAGLMTAD